jgi:hypothetical protein
VGWGDNNQNTICTHLKLNRVTVQPRKEKEFQELLKHPVNLENEIQITQSFIGHIFLGTLSRDAFPGKQMIERMTH